MKHPNHQLTSFLTLHFRPSDHSTKPSRHGATAHQATPTAFAYQAAWSTRLYIPLSPAPLAPVSLASGAVRRAPCRLRYFAYISYSADIVAKDVMSTSPGRAYFLRWITRNHLQHFLARGGCQRRAGCRCFPISFVLLHATRLQHYWFRLFFPISHFPCGDCFFFFCLWTEHEHFGKTGIRWNWGFFLPAFSHARRDESSPVVLSAILPHRRRTRAARSDWRACMMRRFGGEAVVATTG